MQGVEFPAGTAIHVAGPDAVRDRGAGLMVLEDNVRSPSGLAYALEARRMLAAEPALESFRPQPVEDSIELLREALWRAAPEGRADPRVVLLSDGPQSAGWFEHDSLAGRLGIPLVTADDLRVSAGRVWSGAGSVRIPVDVIYRRTDEERLSEPDGGLTALGELLGDPIRQGTVAVANAFGTGVADDKLAHAYVESMIRFYLGEEPMLPSVPTLDLTRPGDRETVLEDLDRMVVKARGGLGGGEVEILSSADPERRRQCGGDDRQAAQRLHRPAAGRPLHPPDGRPAIGSSPAGSTCGHSSSAPSAATRRFPAALTRYAARADSLHVNSSLGGGGKDTWVME